MKKIDEIERKVELGPEEEDYDGRRNKNELSKRQQDIKHSFVFFVIRFVRNKIAFPFISIKSKCETIKTISQQKTTTGKIQWEFCCRISTAALIYLRAIHLISRNEIN